jgi:thiamine transporter
MSAPLVQSPSPSLDLRERLNPNPARWGAQALAEIGVAVALAAVLGLFARLPWSMPQGGSVSLEMIPIIFIAVRRGVVPAAVAGLLYGFLQLVLPGAFVYHPAQAALDYPLAFAALAVAGFVDVRGWRTLALAVSLAVAARFGFHFLSGLVFFASYAPQWESPWLYSATYNLAYLVPEAIVTTLLLWPLLQAYDAAFPGRGRGAAG